MNRYINIHTHIIDNEIDNLNILNVFPEENIPEKSYFSTGIHPWRINENWEKELKIIKKILLVSQKFAHTTSTTDVMLMS